MDLVKQLEDKKKGCGVDIGGVPCGEFIAHTEDEDGREWGKTYYCKHCNEIIAILEQAIAEIKNIQSQQGNSEREPQGTSTNCHNLADISNLLQKQRQEILGLIENEIEFENNIMRELEKDSLNETFGYKWHEGRLTMANEILFKVKQLNQPKTEQ